MRKLELPFVQQHQGAACAARQSARGTPRRQKLLDQEGVRQVGVSAPVFVS